MTLIRIALFKSDPSGVDVPAEGVLHWNPSKRRHVEDPDDHIVLPAPFTVRLGADFLHSNGLVVTDGEPGIAWVEIDPTEIPDWAWVVVERTNRGRGTTWLSVPDLPLVEYADLVVVDPDTLDPDVPATAAWFTELNNRIPASGTVGMFLTKGAGATNAWTDAGSGDVVGPASSVDNRVVRTDGTTGKLIQQSPVTIDDAGAVTGVTTVDGRDVSVDGATLDSHVANTSNPHTVTKAQVGLGSVDNTADTAKPVSTAQQTALDLKAPLASPTFTGTVSGVTKSHVGLGNVDNTADTAKPVSTAQQTALNLKANTSSLATVATSGDYDDLTDKPTIPAQVNLIEGANIDITGSYPNLTVAATGSTGVTSVNGDTGPAVTITKSTVGLANVDNTADTAKPVSTAQQTALDGKQPLDSDLTTIAGLTTSTDRFMISVASNWASRTASQAKVTLALVKGDVGLGNVDNTADTAKPVSTAQQTALDLKAPIASPTFTGTVSGVTKSHVGLGNVDNTADTAKPVSTAQQTALDLKAPLASPTFTGTVAGVTKAHVGLGNVDNVQQQPLDSDLTTIAGLTATTDNMIQSVGSAWASRTPAQVKTALAIAESDVTNLVSDLAAKQPLDSDLTTIAGLTATTDNFMVAASSAWASRTPAQAKTALALAKGDVGLGNVDNTSDATKDAAATTLTNKRITKRVVSTADTATLTIDIDSYDAAKVTALAQAMTIAAPTGTATAMQSLIIRIKDNGTARALTWNAAFRAIGVTLPTTTVLSKTTYVGCIRNTDDSTWDAIAVATQA